MEAIMDEGEWSSMNGMSSEEAVFMSQLLGNCSLPNDESNYNFVASSPCAAFWEPNPNNAAALMYESSMPIGSDFSGGFPFSSQENYYTNLSSNDNNVMDYSTSERGGEDRVGEKRSRPTCEIGSSKKSMKCTSEEENIYKSINAVSSSEEESKAKAKARASRGSATDPQSLYARKRRERINERLRILQTLVPNGTKVDISTMLEEAVQYVKFLQLQIKVLSSDDMWMYAPIAYNGMDIGLDFRSQSS